MCEKEYAPPQGSLENSFNALLEPWNQRAVSDAALPSSLLALFGNDARNILGRTSVIRAQCCAQFVIARENIWMHEKEEYIALRQWLLDGSSGTTDTSHMDNRNAAPANDRVAGRILSYLWHILFIKQDESSLKTMSGDYDGIDLELLNKQACPSAEECYCRLYGRCNLTGCKTPGRCQGQYSVPPDFRLPEDWAVTHS